MFISLSTSHTLPPADILLFFIGAAYIEVPASGFSQLKLSLFDRQTYGN